MRHSFIPYFGIYGVAGPIPPVQLGFPTNWLVEVGRTGAGVAVGAAGAGVDVGSKVGVADGSSMLLIIFC